jgi:hypothetical protein
MSVKPYPCPYCDLIFAWGEDADSAIVLSFGERMKDCKTNAYWKLRCHIAETHFTEGFECPRRSENPRARDVVGQDWWEPDNNTCSYCGSMSVNDFFQAINDGQELTPTDKDYKVYVGNKKFYFRHFNEEQSRLFIETLNAKMIKFAAPGYFYVLPFFIQRTPK